MSIKQIKLIIFITFAFILTVWGVSTTSCHYPKETKPELVIIEEPEIPLTESIIELPPQSIFEADMTYISTLHLTCGDLYEVMDATKSIYSAGSIVHEVRYVNTPDGVNLRTFPNTEYDNIHRAIGYGKAVWVVAEFNEGWSIVDIDDQLCYCKTEYLSVEAPADLIYIDGEVAEYIGTFKLTAYCECEKCCGKWANDNKTASGTAPTEGRTIASNEFPFGTKLNILGNTYIVEDRGVEGMHIDVYFESHEEARIFGVKYAEVYALHDVAKNFGFVY